MNIQPVQPVQVLLKTQETDLLCNLVELTEEDMILSSNDYLEKDTVVKFKCRFFQGDAVIKDFVYKQYQFTYTLVINQINYQPGLVVNTKL